jgi:hypothetical protein
VTIGVADEKPAYAPAFGRQRVDDLQATANCLLVGSVDVFDRNRDDWRHRPTGVVCQYLEIGAGRRDVTSDPVQAHLLSIQTEVLAVEVLRGREVSDCEVRDNPYDPHFTIILRLAMAANLSVAVNQETSTCRAYDAGLSISAALWSGAVSLGTA